MTTSAYIAHRLADQSYRYIYCAYDAKYMSMLPLLTRHYYNNDLVNRLINVGAIESLKPTIGTKHPFDWYLDRYKRWCVCKTAQEIEIICQSYAVFEDQINVMHRDGNYDWSICKPRIANKLKDLYQVVPTLSNKMPTYLYIWEHNCWSVHSIKFRKEILVERVPEMPMAA